MTPSGKPLNPRRLRETLNRIAAELQDRTLDARQRENLWHVRQTLTWALHLLDGGAPAMDPIEAALLGKPPSGGMRLDLDAALGPKPWLRSIKQKRERVA